MRSSISCKLLGLSLAMLALSPLAKAGFAPSQKMGDPPIVGRWDITINKSGRQVPSWLEVVHSGTNTLVGRFVGEGGSARPISKVNFNDGNMSFSIPHQWEAGDKDLLIQATLIGSDSLSGTLTSSDGQTYNWTAVRAPLLKRDKAPVWGTPIKLFNGKDLKGWHTEGEKENQWQAVNGILKSPHSGENIMTDKTFKDFKLHIEFRLPAGSNSGVYLRGRYEVQIEDNYGMEPAVDYISAVYGFLIPNQNAAKPAGEWQTYDITLVGRLVTVIFNGKEVICKQNIPGITGGALNSRESEPGPILLQGDHGPIEYRNIIITPAK